MATILAQIRPGMPRGMARSDGMWRDPAPWNHNIHYHSLILRAVPGGCQRCLDVGCGEGFLARELCRVVPQVAAIDRDGPTIARARRNDAGAGVAYVLGDVLGGGLRPGSFDMIVSIATLHHMDAEAALRQLRELLRPGGTLAVVGIGRSRWPGDLPADLLAMVAHRVLRLRRTYRKVAAPLAWPPPETYAQMRRLAARVLPGVRYRRHLLWRYSLVWTKPAGPSPVGPFLAGPFLAGPFLAGPFLAGPFLAGPFLAGPFLAGPFLAGPFPAGPPARPAGYAS